jgi:hypothetical protein
VSDLDEVLTSLDPLLLHACDAAKLLDEFVAIEARAAAGRTLVADRAVDGAEWARSGYRSPEEWLARKTGTSWGQARSTLETSTKLKELPETTDALRRGELSPAQLNELGPVATPENEKRLVNAAKRDGHKELRRTCTQEKAKTRSDEAERVRHQRIHGERFHRSWIDYEGAWRYEGKATAEIGARVDALIAAEAEQVFKAAHAEGRRESAGAYRFDGFANLLTGGGGNTDTTVVIRVDEARLRGDAGRCEIDRASVPVDVAIGAILAGAFVKVAVTDGVDISTVCHPGRHIPEVLRTAIVERDGGHCVRPGCDSSHLLQIHHYVTDYGEQGPTCYDNLATVCKHDHDLITHRGHRLAGRPGTWKWISPP